MSKKIIFFNDKTKKYYTTEQKKCNKCSKLFSFERPYILVVSFDSIKLKSKDNKIKKTFDRRGIFEFCLDCYNKNPKIKGDLVMERIIILTDNLPEKSVPDFLNTPQITSGQCMGGMSVFEAADKTNWKSQNSDTSETKIIDHTIYSFRTDEAAKLQIQKNKELLERRDKELGSSAFVLLDQKKEMKSNRIKGKIKEKNVDIDEFIKSVKESKILLPEGDKKLLEGPEIETDEKEED